DGADSLRLSPSPAREHPDRNREGRRYGRALRRAERCRSPWRRRRRRRSSTCYRVALLAGEVGLPLLEECADTLREIERSSRFGLEIGLELELCIEIVRERSVQRTLGEGKPPRRHRSELRRKRHRVVLQSLGG